MKKRDIINISVISLFILYIVFYKFVLITQLLRYENVITSLFLIIITFVVFLFLGYKNIKDNPKRNSVFNLVVYEIILYFVIYYASGLFFGYSNNIYSLKIPSIVLNVVCPLLIVVSGEILRHIIVHANKDKIEIIYGITIVLAALELMSTINYYPLDTLLGKFKLIACGLLPILTKHSLLTYLTYHTGLKSSLVYRLILTLYVYFVPILPSYDDYVTCLVELFLPFIVFMTTTNIINKHEYVDSNTKVRKFTITDGIFLTSFILLISLVGGVFNVKMIAIASDSMNPVIYKGDSVIIEKNDGNKIYKEDEIISFDYNGRNTIHRIVGIEKKDGTYYYHTKGDSNNAEDVVLVPINNVYGKVLFKIPLIGYPAVLISEFRK